MMRSLFCATLAICSTVAVPAVAQYRAGQNCSPNVKLVSHVPLAGAVKVSDIEVEQDLSRPYAYLSRGPAPIGFDIVSMKDPGKSRRIYSWAIEQPDLHNGRGVNGKYFKLKGRYYYVLSTQV